LKSKSDFDFEIILDSSQSQTLTLTFDDSDFKKHIYIVKTFKINSVNAEWWNFQSCINYLKN
ncbi:hypothetical protein BpHYR1_025981, partial [Brachionus plicatilis]